MTPDNASTPVLDRIAQRALIVGVAGALACVVGAVWQPQQFLRSYLVGYLFWAGIALGSFAIVMLHHMVGGGWGIVIRRILEAGTRTFALLAVLFLPIAAGIAELYAWADTGKVADDALLLKKSAYLNQPFFLGRAAVYFAIWLGVAWLLNRWSLEQDRTRDPGIMRRLQVLSGPGLLLYGLTATFASVDWVMSLEPHWFSTIYGLIFIVGQGLSSLAFVVLALRLLAEHEPLASVVRPQHFHDLGNLLLAFTMLWGYVGLSQFLIIWSGNLPEENIWYLHRTHGGWEVVALTLIGFHLAVPFLLLLSRKTKRSGRTLASVAMILFLMRFFDLYWLVGPAAEDAPTLRVHWLDVAAPAGIGGIWLWFFIRQLKNRPLLPVGDPRLAEAMEHARH